MTVIRLDLSLRPFVIMPLGKYAYSPSKDSGALRYGSTLRHLKIGWK